MHNNIGFERNERTMKQARKQAAEGRTKPQYSGKQWTRNSSKRDHAES
jgi:hypothetical protein